jgi:hypothetical protein
VRACRPEVGRGLIRFSRASTGIPCRACFCTFPDKYRPV